jgi:hypothetical protein
VTDRTEHRWAVDGIEEEMARIEEDGERMLAIPRYLLPPGAREGQLLRVTRAPAKDTSSIVLTIAIDEDATASALTKSRATTDSAMAKSRKRDPGGDVSL